MVSAEEPITDVVEQFRHSDSDTGSTEVQIALLTDKIRRLSEHLREHVKDSACRRGLRQNVGKRARLLKYLRRQDEGTYQELIERLGLRR